MARLASCLRISTRSLSRAMPAAVHAMSVAKTRALCSSARFEAARFRNGDSIAWFCRAAVLTAASRTLARRELSMCARLLHVLLTAKVAAIRLPLRLRLPRLLQQLLLLRLRRLLMCETSDLSDANHIRLRLVAQPANGATGSISQHQHPLTFNSNAGGRSCDVCRASKSAVYQCKASRANLLSRCWNQLNRTLFARGNCRTHLALHLV